MTLPNFLIIGAAKSGTSALYRYLQQHPDIYMSPIKEPHFFAYENAPPNSQGPNDFINTAITDLTRYEQLYDGVAQEKAIGEASPTYLYVPGTAERIHHHISKAKLIVMLRHPADRAFSAYMHVIRDQQETSNSFEKALSLEDERIHNNWGPLWHFKNSGLYYEQLLRYYEIFDQEQIRVYLYDDFKKDPLLILQDMFSFLGADSNFEPNLNIQANVSGTLKGGMQTSLIRSLFDRPNPVRFATRKFLPEPVRFRFTSHIRNRNIVRHSMSPDQRVQLTKFFRNDILKLQDLIHQDLSGWL